MPASYEVLKARILALYNRIHSEKAPMNQIDSVVEVVGNMIYGGDEKEAILSLVKDCTILPDTDNELSTEYLVAWEELIVMLVNGYRQTKVTNFQVSEDQKVPITSYNVSPRVIALITEPFNPPLTFCQLEMEVTDKVYWAMVGVIENQGQDMFSHVKVPVSSTTMNQAEADLIVSVPVFKQWLVDLDKQMRGEQENV